MVGGWVTSICRGWCAIISYSPNRARGCRSDIVVGWLPMRDPRMVLGHLKNGGDAHTPSPYDMKELSQIPLTIFV